MDNVQQGLSNSSSANASFSKNNVIMILIVLLLLSFLGVNLLSMGGDLVARINYTFGPLVHKILSTFGYTTGTVINKTSEISASMAKTGVDIADGTAHSIGGLLIKGSQQGGQYGPTSFPENALSLAPVSLGEPEPAPEPAPEPTPETNKYEEPKQDTTENPIQKPITSSKKGWCLVGEYEGKRGCIQIVDQDKCLSGQIFPTQKMCLNPTFTNNMSHGLKSVPE